MKKRFFVMTMFLMAFATVFVAGCQQSSENVAGDAMARYFALQSNMPPTATITFPANNSRLPFAAKITFNGTGTDVEDGTLTGMSLQWYSNIDGNFGNGTSIRIGTLSVGYHMITLNVTDSGGLSDTISININITYVPTDCTVESETHITNNAADQRYPAIYGNKIVYEDGRNGNADIYLYNLSSSTETRITNNTAYQKYPKIYGDKIVWMDDRYSSSDVYMYDLLTSTETRITNKKAEYPAIYENQIVWADWRNGNREIYMYDLSTSTETRITNDTKSKYNPAIYGDKIVWTDFIDIYTYDLLTSMETKITAGQSNPKIYGDGIVWAAYRNGNFEIVVYNLSTSTETQITTYTGVGGHYQPAIYGDKIIWIDHRNEGYDIYMYDLSTSAEIRITNNTTLALQQVPIIYGDKIVWEDYRNGNADIYMAKLSAECFAGSIIKSVLGDVDSDGDVDIDDVDIMKQIIVGKLKYSQYPNADLDNDTIVSPADNIKLMKIIMDRCRYEGICINPKTYYMDEDGDGFGTSNPKSMYIRKAYSNIPPSGYSISNTDCDDTNTWELEIPEGFSINPNATEICDEIDNNCDKQIDEGC